MNLLGVYAWFRSDADKDFKVRSREQLGAVKNPRSFRGIRVVLSQRLACLETENCAVCFATTRRPWNDHRTSKRSIDSFNISITLTLYNLARLQAQNSVRVIEFTFKRSWGTWCVKTHFSGAVSSGETDSESETLVHTHSQTLPRECTYCPSPWTIFNTLPRLTLFCSFWPY